MSLPPPPDLNDRTVGRYHILGPLGRGGMGVVYRAEDPRLGRQVALKLLPEHLSEDPHAKERLLVEARAASALDHPHICTVYEVGEADDGRLFLAMACYDGQTLAEALAERGSLPLDEAVALARQVASGLAAAHRKGIVHRDLKPSNVFLCATEVGRGARAKILDFGVAKVAGVDLTQAGSTVGTVAYAPPEQARGEALDGRADLWALGVVLYEMLTGRRPFTGAYDAALLYAVTNLQPDPVRAHRPEVPEALEAVVMRLLEKDPADRFQTAEEAEAALAEVLEGQGPRVPRRRPRWAVPAAGAAALVLVLAFVFRGAFGSSALALPEERGIAVLPFTVVGEDTNDRAFSDGIVEMLASELTQLEQYQGTLWVVPMSEVRDQGVTSAGAARRTLGVNLVVTGSVQRDNARVRIPLSLVDATTLRQLRAVLIEASVSEINALQGEVIAAIEQMLDLEIQPEARRTLAAGGTATPDAYESYLQGLGYLQRYENPANIERAIVLFEHAVGADPRYARAHARLGEAYLRLYDVTEDPRTIAQAEAAAHRAAALSDAEPDVHVTLATLYTTTGRYDEALDEARRALVLDPASVAAQHALAQAYQARGELGAAEAAYIEAIRRKPGFWGGYNALGRFYFRQGRYAEAATQYRTVIRLTPDNVWGYLNLGGVHYYLGRSAEAISAFEQALAIRPEASTYSNLATLYYAEGRYAAAADTYRRALEIDDDPYVVWGNLASVLGKLSGHEDEAHQAYQEAIRRAKAALEVNPNDAALLATLADYHASAEQHDRARQFAERAALLAPDDVEVAYRVATVYEQLGDRDAALHWIERALDGGYPRSLVEQAASLTDLRGDPRYRRLVQADSAR